MSISSIVREHSAFIWSVADLLRGDYKQSEYGRVEGAKVIAEFVATL